MVSRPILPLEKLASPYRAIDAEPFAALVEACGLQLRAGELSDDAPPIFDEELVSEVPAEVIARYFGPTYPQIECHRSDIAMLGRFAHGVELASLYLCVAFEMAGVSDFDPDEVSPRNPGGGWLAHLADVTFDRFSTLRRALRWAWTPPAATEPLIYAAFYNLCDVVPEAAHSLKPLFQADRNAAIGELIRRLDARADLIKESLELALRVRETLADRVTEGEAAHRAAIQAGILEHAGEALSLTQAATALGTSRQNLHKRIGTGSALGVMRGNEIVVPSIQFIETNGVLKIVPHLRDVMAIFAKAKSGHWSALQYLVEHDPMLAAAPVDLLREGKVEQVLQGARAYLGLDEP